MKLPYIFIEIWKNQPRLSQRFYHISTKTRQQRQRNCKEKDTDKMGVNNNLVIYNTLSRNKPKLTIFV